MEKIRITKSYVKRIFIRIIILSVILITIQIIRTAKFNKSLSISKFVIIKDVVFNSFGEYSEDKHEQNFKIAESIPISYSLENCPPVKNEMLNVHFILHTHTDPGWIKTADEYYENDVKKILFSVMEQLGKDPNRKFVYSEIYFFKKWYQDLNLTMKQVVTNFVKKGQLEFVGGGWVQNDDALTHYTVAIDQQSYGINEINKMFGRKARPAFGWQIDSFGYSKEQASLFSQFGFSAEVIQRLAYYDLNYRRSNKQMEFYWQGNDDNKIFTHVLFDGYVKPKGFQNENVQYTLMFEAINQWSKSYRTNHLMMLLGDDFGLKNASSDYENLDQLIAHGTKSNTNLEGVKLNLLISSPSCYLKSVLKSLEKNETSLSVKHDDFFPYVYMSTSIWTGFFSSRPTLKGLIYKISSMLQTVQNLHITLNTDESRKLLNNMREKLFLTLHHDAITGTCKQYVADDYIRTLLSAESIGNNLLDLLYFNIVAKSAVGEISAKKSSSKTSSYFCPLLNVSICQFTQLQSQFAFTVFNDHSTKRREYIRIPVDSLRYIVTDYKNNTVPSEVVETTDFDQEQLPKSNSSKFILLVDVDLPAIGFATYFVRKLSETVRSKEKSPVNESMDKNYIENDFYKITFDKTTGLMSEIVNKKQSKTVQLSQNFFWYQTSQSGAYVLRATSEHAIYTKPVILKRIEKPIMQELRQQFQNWATQTVRLYKNKDYIEVQWTVGPIDGDKEIVTRFVTEIGNGKTFYTDANGRQMMERQSKLPVADPIGYPIAAAYYPVTSMITIKDDRTQLTVLTDRPMGGTSLTNGSLELMLQLHRKMMNDDGAGMGEGLNEMGSDGRSLVVRGIYRFVVSREPALHEPELNNYLRNMAKDMFYSPIVMFSDSLNKNDHFDKYSLLPAPLPDGIHLLSIQYIDDNHILIRLENYFEERKIRAVSLKAIIEVKNCTETVLSGDVKKSTKYEIDIFAIDLKPMSIKTFLCCI